MESGFRHWHPVSLSPAILKDCGEDGMARRVVESVTALRHVSKGWSARADRHRWISSAANS